MTAQDEIAVAGRTDSEAPKSAVGEIADALFEMGGVAHREEVIDRVAIHRGQKFVTDGIRHELVEAFERYCAAMARKGKPALFHLPLGEGSRRWSLTTEVMQRASRLRR